MADYVNVNNLSGLDLAYYFLNALSVHVEWIDSGSALKTQGDSEFLDRKIFIIKKLSDLNSLNYLAVIEKYGIEIAISTNDAGLKQYKCKRFNGKRWFTSTLLAAGIAMVVVDWRYDKKIQLLSDKSFVEEKYNIPLDSLGLSFNLVYNLKKSKLDSIKKICSLSKVELLNLLKNEILFDELKLKLKKIDINID